MSRRARGGPPRGLPRPRSTSQPGDWYVVHSYAGYENRVKHNLENRRTSLSMEEFIHDIQVPQEEVIEIKQGQRKQVKRNKFPGYVLVRMDLTDESWSTVRHTPGVTGFVGHAHQPTPLTLDEVISILYVEPEAAPGKARPAVAAGQGRGDPRRLRGRRVRHGHRRCLRHAARDDQRDQPGRAEAEGARVDLRTRDAGRALVRPGSEALTRPDCPQVTATRRTHAMPPKKKVAGLIKLQIEAGQANPAPPVGPALGQHGVNIMEFCKAYNAATEAQRGNVIPVEITVYEDRSFTFITKTPPAAKLILKAAGLDKGSGVPHKDKVGSLTREQVRSIAEQKMADLNANDLDAAEKIIAGTARSMGVTVTE